MEIKQATSAMAAFAVMGALLGAQAAPAKTLAGDGDVDWSVYGGNALGQHFSPLNQINAANVGQMTLAWRADGVAGEIETTPLVVKGKLYAYTGKQIVVALDAATGKSLWTFDNGVGGDQPTRGLAYWSDGKSARLLAGVMDRLYALNPNTGKPIETFGEHGFVDLRRGLGNDYHLNADYLTSPGVIFHDLIIVGFRTSEAHPAAPGDIRAYDVRTGRLKWSFHTIPYPDEAGAETWPKNARQTAGGANAWAGMVVDQKAGVVYAPTGSAVDDFYGADRKGADLYADTLLALDARTGRRIWHFQDVHHDIWDRDFPAPPVLLTVEHDGRPVRAVAQTTKQGFVFLFDRATGKPLFPIVETPFPASDVPGEAASPTQPVPSAPEPFARQRLTEDTLTNRTPAAHAWALQFLRSVKNGGPFTPLTVGQPTIVFPGYDGGGEWGGPAVDPRRGVLYVNANDVAWMGSLMARGGHGPSGAPSLGQDTYLTQCAGCHGADHKGSPPEFPSLVDAGERLSVDQIQALLNGGRGRMPAFPALTPTQRDALITYLRTGHEPASRSEVMPDNIAYRSPTAPYVFEGYRKFVDPDGYPAVAPPWGSLSAIDLNTGQYLWKAPLGEYPELVKLGLKDTGSENYGGPIVTAGGLVIVAATIHDRKIRAFDADSGRMLWQAELPYAGTATPITYMVHGVQYVAVATSGGKDPKGPQGAAYVAFKLSPDAPPVKP
jgi:quinoprotein glucose dehydrogenase